MPTTTVEDVLLSFKLTYNSYIKNLLKDDTLNEEMLEEFIDLMYDFKSSFDIKELFFCSHYTQMMEDFGALEQKFYDSNIKYVLKTLKIKELKVEVLFEPLYDLFITKNFSFRNKMFISEIFKFNPMFKSGEFSNILNMHPINDIRIAEFVYNIFNKLLLDIYNRSFSFDFFREVFDIKLHREFRSNTVDVIIDIKEVQGYGLWS